MFTRKSFHPVVGTGLLFSLIVALVAGVFWRHLPVSASADPAALAQTRQAEMRQAYGRLPMNFEVNQGQADEQVRFLARGHGYQVFLTEGEAVLTLQRAVEAADGSGATGAKRLPELESSALRLKLADAQIAQTISGAQPLLTKSNYFIGNDPAHWQTEIPNFARVEYTDVYPGISLAYYGTQSALEYDFIVRPGADPRAITMTLEGAENIELAPNGDLILTVAGQKLYHRAPVSYQQVIGKSSNPSKRTVGSRYVLRGGNRIGFEVESYDASKPLVIDPVIDFSTFFGGVGSDEGLAIAVDQSGNAYITGTTYSNNFNTFAPLQTINRGGKYDSFVTKINAAGTTIVYSTYLGGSAEDTAHGIAVDANGNAYIVGTTNSTDFNTRNAFQPALSFADDAFVTKINAQGSDLLFSTYLGGISSDQGFAVALDGNADVYIAGSTASPDFKTRNPLQPTNRGNTDVFVTKMKGDGTQLVYSTYLGGGAFDEAYGVAVDAFGNTYVTGTTLSTDFNVANPQQPANAGGGGDAFVTKINAQGSALAFSTYFGGAAVDVAYSIAVDVNTNAYITGHTFSTNFPLANALQTTNRGGADAFLTRFNANGSGLIYSTYLGGAGGDFARGVAVDGSANAYIVGRTISTDFNTRNPLQTNNRGEFDAFVTKVGLTGQLVYSTYLGGASDDLGFGIAVDSSGNAYVTGDTRSTDFNTKSPLQPANRGGLDAFVTKINGAGAALTYSTYLGGSGEDLGLSIALDTAGNAYITGYTSSNDFGTRAPIQGTSKGGLEVFVTKVLADASDLAFNTYFGGNGSDTGNAIAVDNGGNCYIIGATTSTNLPTRNPIQPTNRGSLDAFVAKFNATGTNIVYSTYMGGTFGDLGKGIAVDLAGSAFITGSTFSDDFPTQTAFQGTNRGGGDAFVARLNAAGTALVYGSYLGGAGSDEAAAITVDTAGNAYVVGNTASGDFNTKNPLQANNRGQQDVFVTKVSNDGTTLVYSTYLGGLRADVGNAIAVDVGGSVYVTGSTASNNFPTQTPLQATFGGGDFDAFFSKINATGSALSYSSYLGGSLNEVGNGIAVDLFGNCYIAGVSNSVNFPLRNPIQADLRGAGDAFITKVNSTGNGLVYSTYLGGTNDDRASGIAVDSTGTAYVTGSTASPDFNIQFPLLAYGGGTDVFVAKIISEPSVALSPAQVELQAGSSTTMTVTISGPQSQPMAVALSSSNPQVVTVPQSVTIPAGAVSADFLVTAVAQGGPITITATLPQAQGGATGTATANVSTSSRALRIASQTVAAGGLLTLPLELDAQGNENRLAFSLSLNATLFSSVQFTLGADASAAGASLTTNTSQAAQGRYGIIITLPAGQTFTNGTKQVLVLSAVATSGTSTTTTTISFGDQPTVRRLADTGGLTLSTNFVNGTITIAQGYEGDVAPRPNGSNGTVTIADWVQTGRFAAGFDAVNVGSEFQRADTAPRASLGNGLLTISDWVQTGRYSSGLDPVVPAGGPSIPAANVLGQSGTESLLASLDVPALLAGDNHYAQQSRVIRATNVAGQRGQQVTVTLELDAQGNENAFGFSLSYDPAQLTYVSAAVGADVSSGLFNINNNQAAQGRLGFAIALPTGQNIAAGNNKKLATVVFSLPANGTANIIPLTFGDQPVPREVVNANADVLTATYTSGAVSVGGVVTTVSAASFAGGDLASEQMVAGFGANMATGVEIASSVPLPTSLLGTTVRVRDSAGTERLSPLFFVAPTQINYLIPAGTANGLATITVTSGSGAISTGAVNITNVAPGLFSANSSGQGVAAAVVLRVKADGQQITESLSRFDSATSRFVTVPIDLGPEGEQVFLIGFGTGARNRNASSTVNCTIGGANAEVLYLGPQGGFVGLDQGNIRVPRSLAGRGEVNVVLTVDGKIANTVTIAVK